MIYLSKKKQMSVGFYSLNNVQDLASIVTSVISYGIGCFLWNFISKIAPFLALSTVLLALQLIA